MLSVRYSLCSVLPSLVKYHRSLLSPEDKKYLWEVKKFVIGQVQVDREFFLKVCTLGYKEILIQIINYGLYFACSCCDSGKKN